MVCELDRSKVLAFEILRKSLINLTPLMRRDKTAKGNEMLAVELFVGNPINRNTTPKPIPMHIILMSVRLRFGFGNVQKKIEIINPIAKGAENLLKNVGSIPY